jgi:hypothetical protein
MIPLPRGGSRIKSGPAKDPTSRTSARAGYVLTALPPSGYSGEAPNLTDFIARPTLRDKDRWVQLWKTPQACAWSEQSWRWPVVADLVKYLHRADAKDSPASLATAVRQLRDDLGLSEAGLKQHGWKIAEPPKEKTTESSNDDDEGDDPRDRLTLVTG